MKLSDPRGPLQWIVHFPTKRHWRDRSAIGDIEAGLRGLTATLASHGIRSDAIPPIGCGLGGLDWRAVRPLMIACLADLPGTVILLEPAPEAEAEACTGAGVRLREERDHDLEALVETSPIGVVVLDPHTGQPVVFNREARRFFEVLCIPGRAIEEMIEAVTCRLSDGREIALDRMSLAQRLKSAETLRAEEVVLSTADGRSVSALVNATPIHAEDGTVESVMVTVQDLAPLEAIDRMRAEFLGMVSHELRTPLAAIKGATTTVLGTPQSFGPTETQQFFRIIDEQADRMSGLIRAESAGPGRGQLVAPGPLARPVPSGRNMHDGREPPHVASARRLSLRATRFGKADGRTAPPLSEPRNAPSITTQPHCEESIERYRGAG